MIGPRLTFTALLLASLVAAAGGDDGTVPKLDYPAVATTAKAGEWVLTINKLQWDRFVAKPDKENVIFYNHELVEPGATISSFKDMGATARAPNSFIIRIPKGGKAKVGDIVLTWWQSGSGMERAIVVDAKDPTQPVVRYIDISYDNPAKGGAKHDTPIGQMEERLKPDTFTVIGKPFEVGTNVACKDGTGTDRKVAHVVSTAGDKLLLQGFAGMMLARPKADCVALPVKPTVKAKDKLMGDFSGTMHAATVTKVDAKIGRVWVVFEGLGKDEHALPFGNVIAKL